jgi:hypothetical protein
LHPVDAGPTVECVAPVGAVHSVVAIAAADEQRGSDEAAPKRSSPSPRLIV